MSYSVERIISLPNWKWALWWLSTSKNKTNYILIPLEKEEIILFWKRWQLASEHQGRGHQRWARWEAGWEGKTHRWATWSCTVRCGAGARCPGFGKWRDRVPGNPWPWQHRAPHRPWAGLWSCAGGCRGSVPCRWSGHGSPWGYSTRSEDKREKSVIPLHETPLTLLMDQICPTCKWSTYSKLSGAHSMGQTSTYLMRRICCGDCQRIWQSISHHPVRMNPRLLDTHQRQSKTIIYDFYL